jgi:LPS-assembly protein
MKNKKIKKTLISLFIFIFAISSNLYSQEFEFRGKEIEIVDNGKKIFGYNGIEVFLDNKKQKITADKFEYDKIKKTLVVIGKIKFVDKIAEIEILSDKAIYEEDKKNYIFNGNINATFLNKFFLRTEEITYNSLKNLISSKTSTEIKDNIGNEFKVSDFKYFDLLKQLNANQVKYLDEENNEYELDKIVLDLNTNQILGKDIAINFDNSFFGNAENDPRVRGTKIFSNKNITSISKGVFTTCKKDDKCPPWVLSAEEIKHDKKKQQMQYKNAWLKLYDHPVAYFPKFYHPDNTTNRQSGFLIPRFSNSTSLGSSIAIPYYKVLNNYNDLTFKPRIYSNEAILLQSEYRHVTKNSQNIFDASFLKKQSFNFTDNTTTSHFFSNSTLDIDLPNFDESKMELNLQTTSNDTYLKTYKLDSPLIESPTTLNSYVSLYGYSETLNFNISMDVYEDLSKKKESDKYTFIYPNFDIEKELENNLDMPGNFTLSSEGYQKKYNTNEYDGVLINNLLYSNSFFDSKGIKSDYKLLIKNINSKGQNSSNFKNEEDAQILPIASYKFTYPLKKELKKIKQLITPIAVFSFSPTSSKSLTKNDERIDINNVYSFNRIGVNDAVESGLAMTIGSKYEKKYLESDKYFSFNVAQNFRISENNDLPVNGSIGEETSDIFANIEMNINENFNLKYDFNAKKDFEKMNYDAITTKFTFNKFISTFQYLDDKKSIDENSFISNKTSFIVNDNSSVSFGTRKNRKLHLTEYYDLIYEYKNDCLKAGIAYKKEFYNDVDLKPEEQIFFTLTVMPFGQIKSPGFK